MRMLALWGQRYKKERNMGSKNGKILLAKGKIKVIGYRLLVIDDFNGMLTGTLLRHIKKESGIIKSLPSFLVVH